MNKFWLLMAFSATLWAQPAFEQLLQEGQLQWQAPAGFTALPIEPDYVLPYEARYLSPDGGLEVRYAIRPLRRIEIDYTDPHNAAPAPNDLFNMLFRALSETLAKDHQVLSQEYGAERAHQDFNAGWAAIAVFDLAAGISDSFRQGLLLAIHQNDAADAYILFLTHNLQNYKSQIKTVLKTLRFQSPPK